MATQNICDVEKITELTDNTNVIVEQNGSLKKFNIKSEFDEVNSNLNDNSDEIAKLNSDIEAIALYEQYVWYTVERNNGTSKTITLPYSSEYLRCVPVIGMNNTMNSIMGYGSAVVSQRSSTLTFTLSAATTFVCFDFSYIIVDE